MSEPYLDGEELKNVTEAVQTTWIGASGHFITDFEKGFSSYIGTKHGVAVTNGTVALHLALVALGIGSGQKVLIPSMTSISCANAVTYTGAKPIFVDASDEYWCMDPEKIEERIDKDTAAIMPVHIYGHPCDMDPILEIAKKHDLYVIEDCAEAHGGEYKKKRVGNFSDIACFSFYGNKIITCFPAGTKILIQPPKGRRGLSRMKNIEDIKVGDSVLSFNVQTSQKEFDSVTRTFKENFDGELLELEFSNHNKMTVTPNHPVFVINKGWVAAEKLSLNDEVIQYNYRGLAYREMYAGKTYEEMFGTDKAAQRKKQHSQILQVIHANPNSNYAKVNWVETAQKIGKANTGKKRSQSYKEQARARMLGMWKRPEFRDQQLIKIKKFTNTPEFREKQRMAAIKNALDPSYRMKVSEGVRRAMQKESYWENYVKGQNMKPNKQELKLEKIINRVFPNGEFGYNGDFRLGIMLDRLIPDFVNVNGKKKVIELFGSYWHKKGEEADRMERYKKCGFECLVIWENELKNQQLVEEKIKTFAFNPNVKIVKLVKITKIPFKGDVYNLETQINHNYFAYGVLVHNCGEGGMCLTNDDALNDRMRMLKDIGNKPEYKNKYYYDTVGYNYRMTNVTAAIGCAQLKKIDFLVERKKWLGRIYNSVFEGHDSVVTPPEMPWAKNVYWYYSILVRKGKRDEVAAKLKEAGIDTRPFFYPIHQLPIYKMNGKLPVTEDIAFRGLNLPSGPQLTEEQIKEVANTILSVA